ncbi:MAG: replication-associated recombination protein A [bacterium]
MVYDLFSYQDNDDPRHLPLAERMRPGILEEFYGQEHLVGDGKILKQLIEKDLLASLIFWGPPGTGKTTLANIIAKSTNSHFVQMSAVTAGVKDLKEAVQQAQERKRLKGRKTILFIDEVHRFNKAQQDFFLPYVEKGTITFIGATTENPSFSVNAALLSRSRVLVLHALEDDDIAKIIEKTLIDNERGLLHAQLSDDAKSYLVSMANGDARSALTTLELAVQLSKDRQVTLEDVQQAVQKKALLYDKDGEEHYNIISALHKSMRGSDVQASLYWLGRMLEAGEDPLYVVRRLVRFASEDVGMADPQALVVCMAAQQAVHFIGMPEGNNALAQAVVYLATAPKSNAVYVAYNQVRKDVEETRNEPVPLHIRNAPTKLMKELDYGKGCLYPHDTEDKVVDQSYFPEKMKEKEYYLPGELGFEREVKKRMEWWKSKRKEKK